MRPGALRYATAGHLPPALSEPGGAVRFLTAGASTPLIAYDPKAGGATDGQLQPSLELQRQAQWRIDYVAAENSMGFHAPQEAAMVLGEAADYARQGELAALRLGKGVTTQAAAR